MVKYPINIHLPTGILLKILLDTSMPVMAPRGDKSKEKPRLPSVKPSLDFIPGIEATHIPNRRLEVEKRKPTAKKDLFLIKEIKFLIMTHQNGNRELTAFQQPLYLPAKINTGLNDCAGNRRIAFKKSKDYFRG